MTQPSWLGRHRAESWRPSDLKRLTTSTGFIHNGIKGEEESGGETLCSRGVSNHQKSLLEPPGTTIRFVFSEEEHKFSYDF